MRNNIFQGTGFSIYAVPQGSIANDWDYNNWYSSSLGPQFKWESVNYSTLIGLCSEGKLECHGFDNLPGFANPAQGDFTLLDSSRNIDRGVLIPGINDRFVGDAPDLGAFEYAVDLPPMVISSARADSNPTKAAPVNFSVTFSNRVSGVNLAPPFEDFRLLSNIPGASIIGITPVSETTYTVRIHVGNKNGTLRLDIVDNDSITDAAGNPLGGLGSGNGDYRTGETYIINKAITTLQTSIFKSQPSYDGWVLESGENTNRGGSVDRGAATFLIGDDAKDQQYRSILSFDTSPLPNKAVILYVQLKIRRRGIEGSDPFGTHGNLMSEIRNGTFSNISILQTADFSAAATSSSVRDTLTELESNWYATELQDDNLALVNLVGTTQFRLFFGKDDNDDLSSDYVEFYSGSALSSYVPQLIVTYYVP
jgi:hypothetical protein